MSQVLVAMVAGTLFGLGLSISQMINPAKVLSFLDILGPWDPSLALVLFGAVTVAAVIYRYALRLPRPYFAATFQLPKRKDIEPSLLAGGVIFGVGWGLVGWCPGPAISSLALARWETWVFLGAMVVGMWICRLWPVAMAGSLRVGPKRR
jgi:uncharacterized membrane protein YedE/YeeE